MFALLTAAVNAPEWVKKTAMQQCCLALRLKADYQVLQNDPESSGKWEKANFFVKLRAMEKLLALATPYTRIIWLDIDVLPNLFLLGPNDERLLTADGPMRLVIDPAKTMGARLLNWLPNSGLPPCDKINAEMPYYNTGVFSINRRDAELLVKRYRQFINHKPGPFVDQDFINYVIASDGIEVEAMSREMNWTSAHCNLDETFRKGKLIHFCGAQKHLIAPAARFLSPS